MYEHYQNDRKERTVEKRKRLAEIKLHQTASLAEIKKKFAEQREDIQGNSVLTSSTKREHYKDLRMARIQAFAEINLEARQQREQVHFSYPLNTWNDFLADHADQGNEQALKVLRFRQRKPNKQQGDALSAGKVDAEVSSPVYQNVSHTITKKGTVIYDLLEKGKIKDNGQQITVHSGGDKAAMAALQMAKNNYGNYLAITGTDTFKATIVRLAVEHHPSVRFDDPALEQIRLTLYDQLAVNLQPVSPKEKGLER